MTDVRRRCEQVVQALDRRIGICTPWDLNVFLDRLEQDRGRPIELVPFSATVPGALCGIWVGTDKADLIFHEEATSRLHQDHIILHEIGHMECGHRGEALRNAEQVRQLLQTEAVRDQVETVLGRGAYTRVEEREAELFATLMLARASRPLPPTRVVPDAPADVAVVQHRIEQIWGRHAERPGP